MMTLITIVRARHRGRRLTVPVRHMSGTHIGTLRSEVVKRRAVVLEGVVCGSLSWALEGKALEGKALEGKALEGKALEGKALEGKALEGKALERKTLEGKATPSELPSPAEVKETGWRRVGSWEVGRSAVEAKAPT